MQKSRSQGNAYPGHSSRHPSCVSQKHPLNCEDADYSLACRDGENAAPDVCQNRIPRPFSDAKSRVSARAASRRHTRGGGVRRAVFVVGEISPEYACARSARGEARKALREWIERAGEAPPELPMWTSRDGWLDEVSGWLATDEGLAECARRHIKPERVLRAAITMAAHADHATGRNCAATNSTVAAGAGCANRTVTTVRSVLSASGLAVEAHRGTGSATASGYGRRPSIWHLVSRPQPVQKPAVGGAVCDLPPSRRDRRVTPVRSQSPSARRARRSNSHPPKSSPKRGRRCAPRPLHVQLLAAGVVDGSRGLDQGHIGRICDVLIDSGLDLAAWTAKTLLAALNADMKTRGWDWPNHIENPASFLRSRLALLPVRPAGAPASGAAAGRTARSSTARADHDSAAAGREATKTLTDRWYADVAAVTTAQQRERLLRADQVKFGRAVVDPVAALANAGRRARRMYPEMGLAAGMTRWATDVLGEVATDAVAEPIPAATSLSTDLLMDLAIGGCACAVCGSGNAVERPQLPLKEASMVCDQCWPVIAAELAVASDIDEGMLA